MFIISTIINIIRSDYVKFVSILLNILNKFGSLEKMTYLCCITKGSMIKIIKIIIINKIINNNKDNNKNKLY